MVDEHERGVERPGAGRGAKGAPEPAEPPFGAPAELHQLGRRLARVCFFSFFWFCFVSSRPGASRQPRRYDRTSLKRRYPVCPRDFWNWNL